MKKLIQISVVILQLFSKIKWLFFLNISIEFFFYSEILFYNSNFNKKFNILSLTFLFNNNKIIIVIILLLHWNIITIFWPNCAALLFPKNKDISAKQAKWLTEHTMFWTTKYFTILIEYLK